MRHEKAMRSSRAGSRPMFKLEARPQLSRFWSYASPVLAVAITVLIGVALFVLLGKNPIQALSMFFWGADQERLRAGRTDGQGDAAADHRARPGGIVPVERLEHRRRRAIRHRRYRRRRHGIGRRQQHRRLDRAGDHRQRRARRHGMGRHRGAAARPLQCQRNIGQPDAGVRGDAAARLCRKRPFEGPGGFQLSAEQDLRGG